jgi:hypothetical protein
MTFEEIQKAEKEKARRGELMRMEQKMSEQRMMDLHQELEKESRKWNAQNLPKNVKSLEEIQAEEQAKQAALDRERETQAASRAKREKKEQESLQTFWNNNVAWNSSNLWGQQQRQQISQMAGSSTSTGGFWEEPTTTKFSQGKNQQQQQQGQGQGQGKNPQVQQKVMLSKSQTMASITTQAAKNKQSSDNNNRNQQKEVKVGKVASTGKMKKDDNDFTQWCTKALHSLKGNVDSEWHFYLTLFPGILLDFFLGILLYICLL